MSPRPAAVAVIVLSGTLLAGSLSAQRGGRARAGRPSPSDAPPDTMTEAAVQDLFRQARASIQNLPSSVQPRLLSDVARDEMRQWPDQGLDDMEQAFRLALSLPDAQMAEKQEIERSAVFELSLRDKSDQARQLARQADVPKAPLYDVLIELAGRMRYNPSSQAQTVRQAGQQLAATVMDLIQECERSDNTFPYHGAAIALRDVKDPLDRLDLTRAAYAWAGNETDISQIEAAVFFLPVGHREVPEMDGVLADVLSNLITRVASTSLSGPMQDNASLGNRLISLLLRVDAARAESLAAQFPAVGANAMSAFNLAQVQIQTDSAAPPAAGRGPSMAIQFFRRGRQTDGAVATFRATVAAPASDEPSTSEDASGRAQFLSLLTRAEALWRHDPGQALAWANQASSLLDQALWEGETVAVLRLATLYHRLGDLGDSNRLLVSCLQEADRQAAAADAAYYADPAQATTLARGYGTAYDAVLAVYSLAARLDFTSTATHAEQAQFVLLKPAVLTRVALVGEVGGEVGRPGGF